MISYKEGKKFIVDGHILGLLEFMFHKLEETEQDADKVLWVHLGKLAEAYFNGGYIKEIKKGDEEC